MKKERSDLHSDFNSPNDDIQPRPLNGSSLKNLTTTVTLSVVALATTYYLSQQHRTLFQKILQSIY